MTVTELFEVLKKDHILNDRASIRKSWQHVKPVIAALGDEQAEAVTTKMVEDFKCKRLEAGRARQTITNEVSMLRRAYNLALQQELIKAAPKIKNLKSSNARMGFLKPQEFQRLLKTLEVLDGAVADAIRCLYLLGWRREEVFGLTWDDCDVDEGTLQLPQRRNKTRRVRRIKTGKDVHDILRRRWLQRKGSFVFHRRGKQIKDFRARWKKAKDALGKPDLYVHDLRRSFARNGILAGVPQKTLMEIAGWTTASIFSRYNIIDEEQIVDALNAVSDYANGKQILGA